MTGKESGLPGTDSEMFKELEIQVRYIHIMLGVVILRTYWKQCHLVYTYLVFENIIIILKVSNIYIMESNGKQESFELVHLLYITLILFVLCTDYHFID